MTILFVLIMCLFIAPAATAKEMKPLRQLTAKEATSEVVTNNTNDVILVGSDTGLYRISKTNNPVPLWTESRVDQIQEIVTTDENGKKTCLHRKNQKRLRTR